MFGDFSITSSYSLWFTPLCFIIGGSLSYLLYRNDKKFEDVKRSIVYLLIALRTITISLLLFLLLNPVLKSKSIEIDNPVVIVAFDNSKSLNFNNDSSTLATIDASLANLKKELGENYDYNLYSFGDRVQKGRDSIKYEETDISELLSEMEQIYTNRNVGAMIIVSDGIYNRGMNPLYQSLNINYPIHVLAVGDTTIKPDVSIQSVLHNDIAYLENKFPINVELSQFGLTGESFELFIYQNNKVIQKQAGKLDQNSLKNSVKFLIEAKEKGLQQYNVVVKTSGYEENKLNNSKTIFVDILDGRQKILIFANAVHPDIAALTGSISQYDKYKVDVKMLKEFNWKFDNYDLIIFHNLPAGNLPPGVIDELTQRGPAQLFIIGEYTSNSVFNELNTGLSIDKSSRKNNEVKAVINDNFALFSVSDEIRTSINEYPPLLSPFGDYKFTSDHDVFLQQKIGRVTTASPLIAFNKMGNNKYGYIIGEGIWRWRLWQFKKTGSHKDFNELIGKMVQYLAVKSDKSRLRISGENTYKENEKISFTGELYNEAYELVNEKDIEMQIIDSAGKTFDYVMNKTSNAYNLNIGTLPGGNYFYKARVMNSKEKLEKSGSFIVSKIQLESFKTVADHQFLFSLAKKWQGNFYNLSGVNDLIEDIKKDERIKPVSHLEEIPKEFIHYKLLFFIILLAISAEWFLRKRSGSY